MGSMKLKYSSFGPNGLSETSPATSSLNSSWSSEELALFILDAFSGLLRSKIATNSSATSEYRGVNIKSPASIAAQIITAGNATKICFFKTPPIFVGWH